MFLTVYEVICDSITENVMKIFTGPSKEVRIFSLLIEKTVSISKSDTKNKTLRIIIFPLINQGKELEWG